MTFAPPFLGLSLVLFTAAAGSGDYEFTARWPNGETLHVCAKPPIVHGQTVLDPCADAMRGLWQPLNKPPIGEAELSCRPRADCFEPASLCIKGHSC